MFVSVVVRSFKRSEALKELVARMLDALDRASAKATFFVVGRYVEGCPDLVVEARWRGHEIGTHLYSQDRGTVFDDQKFQGELTRSREQRESLLGERIRRLRFPYGERGRQDPRAIRSAHGLDTILGTDFGALPVRPPRPAIRQRW